MVRCVNGDPVISKFDNFGWLLSPFKNWSLGLLSAIIVVKFGCGCKDSNERRLLFDTTRTSSEGWTPRSFRLVSPLLLKSSLPPIIFPKDFGRGVAFFVVLEEIFER